MFEFSQRISDLATTILSNHESCIFDVECHFNNPNSGYSYTSYEVTSMLISQDFVLSYMDVIQLSARMRPEDKMLMMENSQNLICTIILRRVNTRRMEIYYDKDPVILTTRVIFDQPADPEKQNQVSSMMGEDEGKKIELEAHQSAHMDVAFQLFEESAYQLRHRGIHGKFDNAKIEDILHFVAQQLEIEFVKIVPPDNADTYTNLLIPATRKIDNVFKELQERNGVYAKGFGYYFTQDTLYVYPLAETEPTDPLTDGVLHIVSAPNKALQGEDGYHYTVGDDVYVLCIAPVNTASLNTTGVENVGNVQMSTNADQVVDKFGTVGQDGKFRRNQETLSIVALKNTAGDASPDMQNIQYNGETSNPFQASSSMAMVDGTIITVEWVHADPRRIAPGQVAIFHYDARKGIYKTQSGIVQKVAYNSTLHDSKMRRAWLGFHASIEMRMTADKQIVE